MQLICRIFACLLGICMLTPLADSQPLRCADISMLDELEKGGAVYTSQNHVDDALNILQENGLNSIRLRLFHTPTERRDGLPDLLKLARRGHDLHLKIILNLHYSDTWADPGKQHKPSAWSQLSEKALRDSVYAHTYQAIQALNDQGTPPVIVQTGNEITNGMLWNTGRVGGAFDVPAHWEKLAGLLHSASKAVRDASSARIMLHIDRGGDPEGARWFFDNLSPYALDYDLIGLSYYPFWHGPFEQFFQVTQELESRYGKPVMLIETAYPWTLAWHDDTHNPVGLPRHVLPGYPATPDGQAAFIRKLWEHVPSGICYWAPEYIAAPGFGSNWENLALFNFGGEVLPGASALGGGTPTQSKEPAPLSALRLFPNPARIGEHAVSLQLSNPACGVVHVYDMLGQHVRTQATLCQRNVSLSTSGLSSGIYWIRTPGMQTIPLFLMP